MLCAIEAALLLPVAYSPSLRFDYQQTLARWGAKFVHPNTVFLGDSLMAGGRTFNGWRDINYGSNGLQTFQIAAQMPKARAHKPRHIVVMAGTNDAIEGPIDLAAQRRLWSEMCRDPRVVVTLAPVTQDDSLNRRIEQINALARQECRARRIVTLDELADAHGRLKPEFSVDGVHPSPAAYTIWRGKLSRLGI